MELELPNGVGGSEVKRPGNIKLPPGVRRGTLKGGRIKKI